jgi:hypothetical protein
MAKFGIGNAAFTTTGAVFSFRHEQKNLPLVSVNGEMHAAHT